MSPQDAEKCIKRGFAWSSCGDKPERVPTKDFTRGQLENFDGLHATKAEAIKEARHD